MLLWWFHLTVNVLFFFFATKLQWNQKGWIFLSFSVWGFAATIKVLSIFRLFTGGLCLWRTNFVRRVITESDPVHLGLLLWAQFLFPLIVLQEPLSSLNRVWFWIFAYHIPNKSCGGLSVMWLEQLWFQCFCMCDLHRAITSNSFGFGCTGVKLSNLYNNVKKQKNKHKTNHLCDHAHLPKSSSFSSLRASLLSRRSCFSISALIRLDSFASSLRQQAIMGSKVITAWAGGGKSPSDKERRATPPPRVSECRSPLSSWLQSCCFVQNLALFADVQKTKKCRQRFNIWQLCLGKKKFFFKLRGQWEIYRKSALQHVHFRRLQTCN